MRDVWKSPDLDVTSPMAFVVNRQCGGFTLGAFDGTGRLLGFSHTLPARDARHGFYFYSHLLAVDETTQNSGLGYRLKLAQRDAALARNATLIRWTFDPLQARNAHLNLHKLGGIVRRFLVNFYGDLSASPLHRGRPTDRLLVDWHLDSAHVRNGLQNKTRSDTPAAVLAIPREIQTLKTMTEGEAQAWQMRVRAAFQQHLDAGRYCAGFDKQQNHYLFFHERETERFYASSQTPKP